MDSIGLKLAGYHFLSDLLILSGRTEWDLRREAERLGIVIEHFAMDVVETKIVIMPLRDIFRRRLK